MAATQTPTPRKVDLAWRVGSTELQPCQLAGADSSLDLTTVTDVEFRVKDSSGAVALQLNKTTSGVTIQDGAAVVEVSLAQVKALTVGATYNYGIRLWTQDGRKFEQQYGQITVATTVFADEDDTPPVTTGTVSTDMTGENLWQAT